MIKSGKAKIRPMGPRDGGITGGGGEQDEPAIESQAVEEEDDLLPDDDPLPATTTTSVPATGGRRDGTVLWIVGMVFVTANVFLTELVQNMLVLLTFILMLVVAYLYNRDESVIPPLPGRFFRMFNDQVKQFPPSLPILAALVILSTFKQLILPGAALQRWHELYSVALMMSTAFLRGSPGRGGGGGASSAGPALAPSNGSARVTIAPFQDEAQIYEGRGYRDFEEERSRKRWEEQQVQRWEAWLSEEDARLREGLDEDEED